MTIIPPDIQNLNVEQIDFNNHEFLKNLIKLLLNVIESQSQTIEELKKENQLLKDEINRLKGEKAKPKISPNVPEKKEDIQSPSIEKKKNWSKAAKKPLIKIDRTEVKYVDKSILPPDAVQKGYRTVVVQNIKFATDNVEYKLEYYYSKSERKTYEAELPNDIRGEFGTELKAFICGIFLLDFTETWVLTHSYYAKLLATRNPTLNKGKRTAGIDGETWSSSEINMKAALSLTDKKYVAKPLKRVYIEKYGSKKKRPLGIPTMYDRAMQSLYALALEPIAEAIGDKRSFGFRKFRSTHNRGNS